MAHITSSFVTDRGVHLGTLFYNGQNYEHKEGDPWFVSLKFVLETEDPQMIEVTKRHFENVFPVGNFQFLKNTDNYLAVVYSMKRTMPVQKPGEFTRTQARNLAQRLLHARWQ